MRDYLTKVDNTAPLPTGILSADEDNVRFEELKKAVETAGITVDPVGGPSTDNRMLAQAMARYASGAVFCSDSGNANVYILATTGLFVAPKAYFHGMRVGFMPGNSCSGPSTVNCFTLGIKKLLRPDASALVALDVFANRYVEAWYDSAADLAAMNAPARLVDRAAALRRAAVSGTASIPVGARTIPVWVDAESRGALTGLVVGAQINPAMTANWLGSDGAFHALTASEIQSLATGVMAYVQSCFDRQAVILGQISGGTITTMDGVDAAWNAP